MLKETNAAHAEVMKFQEEDICTVVLEEAYVCLQHPDCVDQQANVLCPC